MNIMNFPGQINVALASQGRTKKWLASIMGVTYKTLYVKILNDSFSISEKHYVSLVLNLKDSE